MDSASAMKLLDEMICACQLCKLSTGRTNAVPGTGPVEGVDLVMVGEAPGRNEDQEGRPFVGAGGKLLDELLASAGLDRSKIYITNAVKCRPPENRKPEDDEVKTCTTNYLEKQLSLLKPILICTLGATSLEYFTGKTKMGEARGKLITSRNGIPLLPTYHPAAVFRNPSYRALLEADLKLIPELLSSQKKKGNQTTLTSY